MKTRNNKITAEALQEVRNGHRKVTQVVNDRIAVIVSSPWGLGVQYWTAEMIAIGKNQNTDRTKSKYIANL